MPLFRKEALESTSDRLHGDVVFSQPLSTRMMAGSLFLILAIAGVWLTIGNYARVETVPGILVTTQPSAKIVAPQQGRVSELAIQEGQYVAAGDVLLVVHSDRQTSTGGAVAGQNLNALGVRRQLAEAQVELAGSRAASERRRLEAAIRASEEQAASLSQQITLQREVVASNSEMFEQMSSVLDRGFVSKVDYERRRQALLNSQQNLASLEQRKMAAASDGLQAREQLASVGIEAAQGISRIQDSLQSLAAEEARLQGEQSYVITAPISGRVTALATGLGRSVDARRPLMTIVPEGSELTAELYAPSRAIGMVEGGKETRLLYDAFPYQRFGSFQGTVTSVSRTAVDPRETEIPFPFEEPVYRVRVELDHQSVEAFGEPTPLQAGMTLQANIVLERQSFLAWILQPLNAILKRNS